MDQQTRRSTRQFFDDSIETLNETEKVFVKLEILNDSDDAIDMKETRYNREYGECNANDEKNINFYNIKDELTKINQRLNSLEAHTKYQRNATEKILRLLADLTKIMQKKSSPESYHKSTNLVESVRSLAEFENMKLVETEEGLLELESKLKDLKFNENFKRYLRRIYDINGKRDGSAFFKTLIRRLISPLILSPYSWEGIQRTKKTCTDNKVPMNITTKSFKNTFPTFINFVASVLQESDQHYTIEKSIIDFSTYLRQRNTEIKRFLEGGLKRRASAKRKHPIFRNPTDKKKIRKESCPQMTLEEIIDNGENNKTAVKYLINKNLTQKDTASMNEKVENIMLRNRDETSQDECIIVLEGEKCLENTYESIRIDTVVGALWDKNPILSTEEDFEEFEEKLGDANCFEYTVNFMVTLGGSDHIELTNLILKRFLSQNLALHFNMTGKNHRNESKKRFTDTRLLKAILKAAQKKCEIKQGLMFDEDALKKSTVATWLTQAPTREKRAQYTNST